MRDRVVCVVALAVVLSVFISSSSPASAGILSPKKGKGGSEIQGAAGTGGAQGEAGDLQKCDKPMGAIAVVEPQDYVHQALSRYGLQSPTPLIRMMIQQSNCFLVVERGAGMQNLMQERQLQQSGELRQESNMGGGQMVTADFVLTPNVVFSEGNAGGVGAGLGGLLRGKAAVVGAVAGGLKFKEAQTSMLLTDARSGLQVAAAEGSTKKADFRAGGILWGGGAVGALGGYSNTNEGKIIASAFLDNYNNIVNVVRGDESLQRDVGTLKQEAGKKVKGGAVFQEGDVLHAKIDGVKVFASASDTAKVVGTLKKSDDVIFMGEESEDGYVKVEGAHSGWVKKVMVVR